VVDRDGVVYGFDKSSLGHTVNADFIGGLVSVRLPLGGYGRTIHRLDNLDNKDRIGQIFQFDVGALDITGTEEDGRIPKISTKRQVRTGSKPYVAEAAHNVMQLQLYYYLCRVHGKQKVRLEEDYADIVLDQGNSTILYEVKPYPSAIQCIREALGQLLLYSYRIRNANQHLQLAVVGPSEPSSEGRMFLQYVKDSIRLPVSYMSLASAKLTEH